MATRVLVTGAAGMLGGEVVDTLAGTFDVAAVDVGDFDVTDSDATSAAIRQRGPDVIVNCAAYTDVDGAEGDRDTAFAVNAIGAENVAKAAVLVAARVVQLSTDYVFDGSSLEPYDEHDEPRPLSVYGESKLEAERSVSAICQNHLIVRTAWLYGHRGPNFVEKMLELAQGGGPLRIVDDQTGSPTNVRDLAVILKELVSMGATGIVNATNSGHCTWYGFAREILTKSGNGDVAVEPVTSAEFTRPATRPKFSVLSLRRLESLLGWTPRTWQEALTEYLSER